MDAHSDTVTCPDRLSYPTALCRHIRNIKAGVAASKRMFELDPHTEQGKYLATMWQDSAQYTLHDAVPMKHAVTGETTYCLEDALPLPVKDVWDRACKPFMAAVRSRNESAASVAFMSRLKKEVKGKIHVVPSMLLSLCETDCHLSLAMQASPASVT